MTGEIVSVGTELLLGQIVDTHAPHMAQILAACGISCNHRQTVGDNLSRLTQSLTAALQRADVVVTIGGLGPTEDDLTREGIAAALGLELVHDPGYETTLREIFSSRKFAWVDSNLRQCQRPPGAQFIDNPNGTAPGLICQHQGKTVIALPGPRHEFRPMADGPVREFLERLSPNEVIHSRIIRTCGIGESFLEEQIRDLMKGTNPTVAPYAHPSEVHLRITARAATREEADRMIDPIESNIRSRLGNKVYGLGETTLEQAVYAELKKHEYKLAVAESITGGWLGQRITSVPGSGDIFLGGAITYSVDVKEALVHVDAKLLEEHGPVSAQAALAMAQGIRDKLGADFAVSLTGNAGPTSDVDGKPVGLLYVGVVGPKDSEVREHKLRGAREDIRQRATQLALIQLREALMG